MSAERMVEEYKQLVADKVRQGTARGYALGARDMLNSVEDGMEDVAVYVNGEWHVSTKRMHTLLENLYAQVEQLLEQTGGTD